MSGVISSLAVLHLPRGEKRGRRESMSSDPAVFLLKPGRQLRGEPNGTRAVIQQVVD